MAPWLASCFIFILLYIKRKGLFNRNLATISSKSKLSVKIQCFNAFDGTIKMIKND